MKEHFSNDLAQLFREERLKIDPEWFARDGLRPEIDQIMQQLFERM